MVIVHCKPCVIFSNLIAFVVIYTVNKVAYSKEASFYVVQHFTTSSVTIESEYVYVYVYVYVYTHVTARTTQLK